MAKFSIDTERLRVREWFDTDVEPFYAMGQDAEVMEFLLPIPTLDDARAFITRQHDRQTNFGYCLWAVERQADNAFLGFCGLQPGPTGTPLEDRLEIGWRLQRNAWGQGYAREAATACLDWAWTKINADSVWAITVPANKRSWGLMERLGMSRHVDLDFDHPVVPPESPLRRHVTYSIAHPR
jgi:RimJ/RimL family protein N-acetyltransferase